MAPQPLSAKPESAVDSAAGLVSRHTVLSSSILLAESFVRLGLVALVSFWIARQLGPAQFGLLNYASAVVMVFLAVASLGLETPVVLRMAREVEVGAVMGSALVLRALAGAIGVAMVWAAVTLLRPGDELLVMVASIAALSIPLASPAIVDCWFKVRNEALRPALARLAATLLSCAAKAGCVVLGGGVVALAWTVAFESLVVSAALALAYLSASRQERGQRLVARQAVIQGLLKECVPYVLSIAAIAAYMKIDVVLLGVLESDTETGVYSLCQKLSEVLYILPVVVVDVLYPRLARRQAGADASVVATSQSFFDATLAAAFLGTVVAIVLVGWTVPTLFGEAYRRSAQLFQVHAWSCIGIATAYARYKWMAAVGLQRYAPKVTLIGLALALVLNLILIPPWGAWGAAVATVSAYAFAGHAASYLFPALRPAAHMQTLALWPWFRLVRALRARRPDVKAAVERRL